MDTPIANRLKFLLALLIAFTLQLQLNGFLRNLEGAWVELPWEQSNKWNPTLFQVLTFGQLPAAIDWLWMRSLQDPSLSHVPPGVHPPAYYDLDLATDLDPAFFEAYADGVNYLVVIRDDKTGARDLLLKGERFRKEALPGYPEGFRRRFWENSWSVPLLLAYVYIFELDDMPNAAQTFRETARIPGAPDYLESLASRLEKPLGEYDVGLRLLSFLIDGAQDPNIKEGYQKKRRDLMVARYLKEVETRLAQYRAASPSLSREPVQRYWSKFLDSLGITDRDPFGGTLTVSQDGKVSTTTEYEAVFGLK